MARDDDDRPRRRRPADDDDDDRPRKRRVVDEDEDDRPSKRRVEDDEDDRPRKRRVVDEDDEDDRPRKRRRDDDDDDDRPRKKKKKGGKGLLIGLIAGGAVLVIGLVILLIVLLSGGGSNYSKHEAAANEVMKSLEALAVTLESVKDKSSASAAAAKIDKICSDIEAVAKRVKALPKLTKEEEAKLETEMTAKLDKLKSRMDVAGTQAGMSSQGDPAFMSSMMKFGKAMMSLKDIK